MGGENDGRQVIFNYILDYWHLLIIWLGIVYVLFKCIVFPAKFDGSLNWKLKTLNLIMLVLVILPLMVIGARGGWQYRPIDMITATSYVDGKNVSLVLNSPFCIIKSASKSQLEPLKYFKEIDAQKLYSPYHLNKDTVPFTAKNVVIIIMESFGSEYSVLANDHQSLTPFFDSLAAKKHPVYKRLCQW